MLNLEDFTSGDGGAVERLSAALARAIEDIPHVGKYCKNKNEKGYCAKDGHYCCNQIHTPCAQWEWRGGDA